MKNFYTFQEFFVTNINSDKDCRNSIAGNRQTLVLINKTAYSILVVNPIKMTQTIKQFDA